MDLVDEVTIEVKAGSGGPGVSHFAREKYVPLAGPDGGDGGDGGSVIMVADSNIHTLLDFTYRPRWEAKSGRPGGTNNRAGRDAEDLIIRVPVGTEVLQLPEKTLIVDFIESGQSKVIAKGGRGGKGNTFFKSATDRAPEHSQPGESGGAGSFLLSLKLIADVALVGLPNAGKSTLISRISAAKPKIANYPFTTLSPNLGVVKSKGSAFVVADIPGLISGAHQGKGLGIKFLKHIERCKFLAHLIEALPLNAQGESRPLEEVYEEIRSELESYSQELAAKPELIVITKADLLPEDADIQELIAPFQRRGLPCLAISSATGKGLEELVDKLGERVFVST